MREEETPHKSRHAEKQATGRANTAFKPIISTERAFCGTVRTGCSASFAWLLYHTFLPVSSVFWKIFSLFFVWFATHSLWFDNGLFIICVFCVRQKNISAEIIFFQIKCRAAPTTHLWHKFRISVRNLQKCAVFGDIFLLCIFLHENKGEKSSILSIYKIEFLRYNTKAVGRHQTPRHHAQRHRSSAEYQSYDTKRADAVSVVLFLCPSKILYIIEQI